MGVKKNKKYWRNGLFDSARYMRDWFKKHPGASNAAVERHHEKHPLARAATMKRYYEKRKKYFYSKGLTSTGNKRKV